MSEFLFLLSAVVFGLLIVSSFTLRFIADLINVMTPVDYKPRVKPQTTNKIDEMSIFTEECERLIILTTSTPFDPEDVGHENWRLMLWGDEHGPLGIYDNVALIGNRLCSTLVYHLEEGGLIWNDRPRPRQPITSRQILRDAEGKPCAFIAPAPQQQGAYLVILAPGISTMRGGEFRNRETEFRGRSWAEVIKQGLHRQSRSMPRLKEAGYN